MAFDLNAFRDAHRPWVFTVGTRAFSARHVSAIACQAYERKLADAALDPTISKRLADQIAAAKTTRERTRLRRKLYLLQRRSESRRRRALWWMLRLAFPWRFSYTLRGDPVKIILDQLEPPARQEALRDFFVCLRGEKSEHPSQTIRGTRSSTPTLRREA